MQTIAHEEPNNDESPDRHGGVAADSRVVTMHDVAQAAGVSTSVVSYVLNDTRPVSANKRARVREAIARLGYIPNGMARGLRSTSSHMVGLIVPDLTRLSYGFIAKSIEQTARSAGYLTVVCNATEVDAQGTEYFRALRAARVDGMIVRATRDDRFLLAEITNSRVPVVMIMYEPAANSPLDSVIVDNALGAQMAVEHLVAAGHTRIGLVSSFDLARPTMVRLQGFLTAVTTAGLSVNMAHVRTGPATVASGASLMAEILDSRYPPTAVVLAHEQMSIGALQTVATRGIRVPRDLSLVAWDVPVYNSLVPEGMTTITMPYQELGRLAGELLLSRISGNGSKGAPERIILHPELRGGASVAAPCEASAAIAAGD